VSTGKRLDNAKKSREVIEKLLSDPDVDVRDDGTVWKRVVSHDNKMTYKTKSVTIARLILLKYTGVLVDDLPVSFKDNDPTNLRPDNLYQGPAYSKGTRRLGQLTFGELTEIRETDDGTDESRLRLAYRYGVATNEIDKIRELKIS
jgi:hypothetical protein